MQSLLKDIDTDKTVEAAKEALEKYQYYRLSVPNLREPKITPAYCLTPGSNTNEFHSDTEDCAVYNVDSQVYREKYIERVNAAIQRLKVEHQRLIRERFLLDADSNLQVSMKMNYSERNYYRKQEKALICLAFALRIEVYEEEWQTFGRDMA
jgi:ArpU family phage transcriptional regulator